MTEKERNVIGAAQELIDAGVPVPSESFHALREALEEYYKPEPASADELKQDREDKMGDWKKERDRA